MRFEATESFRGDFRRLPEHHKRMFRRLLPAFNSACDAFVSDARPFPKSLRVKAVKGAQGVWEMSWSFSGPDGRATFEWVEVPVKVGRRTRREPAVRWRRIGGHEVFAEP